MIKRYKNYKTRKKGWDYSRHGLYFITIITHGRKCIFGEIRSKQMIYSPLGEIVCEEWLKSFEIRQELQCLSWIIMPNHIHAILKIENDLKINRVIQNPGIAYRPPRSISSFVAGFKSAATKRINQLCETPGAEVWQDLFYDHIIRDEASYQKIHDYIRNNPGTWEYDRFHCR
jgi:putative transposase